MGSDIKRVILKAGCKINLYLNIKRKRGDGYHDIESLFIPLSKPYDLLYIEPHTSFKVRCNVKELEGPHNILYKTYNMFTEVTSYYPRISIFLKKNIPFGSGLGGASSNAAALLKYLNSITPSEKTLSFIQLIELAKRIGGDVPFFLINKISWVEGIGDKINVLDQNGFKFPFKYMLLVIPPFKSSTRKAYNQWDRFFSLTNRKKTFNSFLIERAQILINSFENVLFVQAVYRKLKEVKKELLVCGFGGVVLSGSGSSMVAVTDIKDVLLKGCVILKVKGWKYYVYRINWGVAKG